MKTIGQVQKTLKNIRDKIEDVRMNEIFCEIESFEEFDPGEFTLDRAIYAIEGTLVEIKRVTATPKKLTMTAQDIIKRLQAIADELEEINTSDAFKALIDHPEFSTGDITLADTLIGVEETLNAIDYVIDFELMKILPDCPEEESDE